MYLWIRDTQPLYYSRSTQGEAILVNWELKLTITEAFYFHWNENQHIETKETEFLLTVIHDGNYPLNLQTAKTDFLYFNLCKPSHHLPRVRTTFIDTKWWLMTSVACSRELNTFYNSNSTLDNFRKKLIHYFYVLCLKK